jgi:hypothetical protein
VLNNVLSSAELLLYNRYYWFLKFARLFVRENGPDAGLEQQAFQILENSEGKIDWSVIEAIECQVENEIGPYPVTDTVKSHGLDVA